MKVVNLSANNSLLNQFMKELRSVDIQHDSMRFRRNIERIGEIMAYEISKELTFENEDVVTPLGVAPTNIISDKVVVASILRAGLPLHQGILNYFDRAENAFVSAYRHYKEEHNMEQPKQIVGLHEIREKVNKHELDFDIHVEYIASPHIDNKVLILADPMLATGSSMELAYGALLSKGKPKHVHIATVISSKAAIDYVTSHLPHENITLWTAAIDPIINDHSYIIPGLGDAGDLAYGEKSK